MVNALEHTIFWAYWTLSHDISGMEQDIKKLQTSSNSTPSRTLIHEPNLKHITL